MIALYLASLHQFNTFKEDGSGKFKVTKVTAPKPRNEHWIETQCMWTGNKIFFANNEDLDTEIQLQALQEKNVGKWRQLYRAAYTSPYVIACMRSKKMMSYKKLRGHLGKGDKIKELELQTIGIDPSPHLKELPEGHPERYNSLQTKGFLFQHMLESIQKGAFEKLVENKRMATQGNNPHFYENLKEADFLGTSHEIEPVFGPNFSTEKPHTESNKFPSDNLHAEQKLLAKFGELRRVGMAQKAMIGGTKKPCNICQGVIHKVWAKMGSDSSLLVVSPDHIGKGSKKASSAVKELDVEYYFRTIE